MSDHPCCESKARNQLLIKSIADLKAEIANIAEALGMPDPHETPSDWIADRARAAEKRIADLESEMADMRRNNRYWHDKHRTDCRNLERQLAEARKQAEAAKRRADEFERAALHWKGEYDAEHRLMIDNYRRATEAEKRAADAEANAHRHDRAACNLHDRLREISIALGNNPDEPLPDNDVLLADIENLRIAKPTEKTLRDELHEIAQATGRMARAVELLTEVMRNR